VDSNLYSVFRRTFPSDPSRPFLETEERTGYSYQDLENETARYAALLTGLGLVKGDRLVSQVEKSPQALFLYLACVRAGIIYLPLNPAYRKHEMGYVLSDAEPKAVVCSPSLLTQWQELVREAALPPQFPKLETMDENGRGTFAEKAASLAPQFAPVACEPNDTAAIVYTSGTTGRPKGAMISHLNIAANGKALHDFWRWTPNDVLLHAVPLFHVHGLFIACSCALFSGVKIIFLPKFEVRAVMRYISRATVLMGVPTYYTRLLEQPDFTRELCRSMRLFISGSAPLLEQTFAAFEERTGFGLVDRYGMTETGANSSNPVDAPIPGTVGVPLPGVTIRVADENGNEVPAGEVGEIQMKGDNVFTGYWRKPSETAAAFTPDGFFKSGDLGRRAPNGYLCIVGRSKDLVITGGLNVYPKEIESTIDQMDGVTESAVIGLPHPDFGEAVVAVVVRDKGREDVTEERIIRELKTVMANYKIPKRVFFAGQLPRNTMAKVQKNLLRANPEYRDAFASTKEPA
jgi:malonyl-CoA/methylmalonyl-CoA synthetase